jgi:hypothetical protein
VNTRCCSRTACKKPPVFTLTYVYRDSTAVLGPLAVAVDPHSWDLCEMHAGRLVVPRGWDVVRLPPDPAQERADDLGPAVGVRTAQGGGCPAPRGGTAPSGRAAWRRRLRARRPGRRGRPPRAPAGGPLGAVPATGRVAGGNRGPRPLRIPRTLHPPHTSATDRFGPGKSQQGRDQSEGGAK